MPIVKLSMIEGRTKDEKAAAADLVHRALMEAFKIPENDKSIRIFEFKKENFIIPPGRTEEYILVEITVFPGRSLDAKRLLYHKIVENFKSIGVDPNDVFIILYEEALDNWGIRGGNPASEVNIGFNLKV